MNILKNVQIHSAEALPILLDVYFKTTRKAKPVVVFCHGFKTFKDWGTMDLIAKEFANNDFVFLKFNFSHNGTTVETPNLITDTDDVNSIVDFNFVGFNFYGFKGAVRINFNMPQILDSIGGSANRTILGINEDPQVNILLLLQHDTSM